MFCSASGQVVQWFAKVMFYRRCKISNQTNKMEIGTEKTLMTNNPDCFQRDQDKLAKVRGGKHLQLSLTPVRDPG